MGCSLIDKLCRLQLCIAIIHDGFGNAGERIGHLRMSGRVHQANGERLPLIPRLIAIGLEDFLGPLDSTTIVVTGTIARIHGARERVERGVAGWTRRVLWPLRLLRGCPTLLTSAFASATTYARTKLETVIPSLDARVRPPHQRWLSGVHSTLVVIRLTDDPFLPARRHGST